MIGDTAEVKDLYIQTGASLIITGAIEVAGTIHNNGNFNVSNGTLDMEGSAAQTISGSMFENHVVKNLMVSNTGSGLSVSSTPGDTLKITGILSFGNTNSVLNTGDNITIVSDSAGTGAVGVVGSGNAINGNVDVERYVNIGLFFGPTCKIMAVPCHTYQRANYKRKLDGKWNFSKLVWNYDHRSGWTCSRL